MAIKTKYKYSSKRLQGVQRDNHQVNPPKGYHLLEVGKVMEIKDKINSHPGHLLRIMGEEVEMVVVVVVEVMMMMIRVMMKMRKTQNRLLRVRGLRNKLHLVIEVYQQKQEVEEVMDHHLT